MIYDSKIHALAGFVSDALRKFMNFYTADRLMDFFIHSLLTLWQVRKHVNDLYEDLRDGHNLISLLEVLSGETLVSIALFQLFSNHFLLSVHCLNLKHLKSSLEAGHLNMCAVTCCFWRGHLRFTIHTSPHLCVCVYFTNPAGRLNVHSHTDELC